MPEKTKFYLYCPECGIKHPGKRKMFHNPDKSCQCGYVFTEDEMQKQLNEYLKLKNDLKNKASE